MIERLRDANQPLIRWSGINIRRLRRRWCHSSQTLIGASSSAKRRSPHASRATSRARLSSRSPANEACLTVFIHSVNAVSADGTDGRFPKTAAASGLELLLWFSQRNLLAQQLHQRLRVRHRP